MIHLVTSAESSIWNLETRRWFCSFRKCMNWSFYTRLTIRKKVGHLIFVAHIAQAISDIDWWLSMPSMLFQWYGGSKRSCFRLLFPLTNVLGHSTESNKSLDYISFGRLPRDDSDDYHIMMTVFLWSPRERPTAALTIVDVDETATEEPKDCRLLILISKDGIAGVSFDK